MRKLIVVGVIVAVVALVVVAVVVTTRRDSERPTPGTTSTAGSAAVGSARGRSASIPVGKIIRDAKRRVPDDAGPARDPALGMVIPPEFRSPCPQCMIDPPAVIEGALGSIDVMTNYAGLAQWFQVNAQERMMPRYVQCKAEFLARGGVIERDITYLFALRVVSDGQHARVVEVLAPPDLVPAELDGEIRECWLRGFSELHFPAKETVDVTIEYGVSL